VARRGVYGLAAGGGEHGQKDGDKENSWGCASGARLARRGLWRGLRPGGGRSARRRDVELAHAKCSTLRRPSERGLMQPGGRQQMQGHVLGRVALSRGV
jgi:hypothetical protein